MIIPKNGSLAKAVRVDDLRAYLLGNGWKIRPFARPEVLYFEGPPDDEGRPLVQLIPASDQLRDYSRRVEEVIEALSTIENRAEDEIFRSIVTPTCDILRVRLETDETRSGTLDFGFVGRFFSNLKNLLTFAACGKFRPQPFFPRALKDAIAFADNCRVRPAPVGSFVVEIESPIVPPATQAQRDQKSHPVERQILLALMNGLGTLQSAIESGDKEDLFLRSGSMINANICEAILGLRPDHADARLEATVSWSPAWPVESSDSPRPPQRVSFAGRAFEQIDAIGYSMRTGDDPQDRLLVGRVIRLSAEDPLRGAAGSLKVTIRPEGKKLPSNVDLVLSADQYRTACDAHRDGKNLRVNGTLGRGEGRKWIFYDITGFAIDDSSGK